MGLTVASPDAVSFLDLGSGVGKRLGRGDGRDGGGLMVKTCELMFEAEQRMCSFPP